MAMRLIVSRPLAARSDRRELNAQAASGPAICCWPQRAARAARSRTFLRDVAPILNKAGCTSGPCHGAAKGKNGFKLSLRGYDPQFDYEALLYDLSRPPLQSRRSRAQPDARQADAAGRRMAAACVSRRTRATTRRSIDWIAAGRAVRRSREGCSHAARRRAARNLHEEAGRDGDGEGDGALRRRHHARCDRETRPSRAMFPMSRRSTDAIGQRARAWAKPRCWFGIRASSSTIPVTVLNPKPGFAWKPLPQHNYIDQLIDAKLQKLKIQPSAADRRCGVPAARIARSDGPAADARRGAGLSGRRHAVAAEAQRR